MGFPRQEYLRWVQLCSMSILWHCLSLGLEWKPTFSSPVATVEFSKFAGILSVALYKVLKKDKFPSMYYFSCTSYICICLCSLYIFFQILFNSHCNCFLNIHMSCFKFSAKIPNVWEFLEISFHNWFSISTPFWWKNKLCIISIFLY